MTNSNKLKIVLDFDGVIHSYSSGWTSAANIPDPPVDGAIEWMADAQSRGHKLMIQSMRTADENYLVEIGVTGDGQPKYTLNRKRGLAIDAIKQWLIRWSGELGVTLDVEKITFPFGKAFFDIYIDDRGYRAEGPCSLPDLKTLKNYSQPWFKKTTPLELKYNKLRKNEAFVDLMRKYDFIAGDSERTDEEQERLESITEMLKTFDWEPAPPVPRGVARVSRGRRQT
jgi:hypothetical protein